MAKIAIDAGHYLYEPGRHCWKEFDPNQTCYILDICGCVLHMIRGEEYSLKNESYEEIPIKDRLNKDSKFFYFDGGFGDSSYCYFYSINHDIFPIACERKQKELFNPNEILGNNCLFTFLLLQIIKY